MTQFKDKTAKGQNANVGLFAYPMLMAADILMYDADQVPVGEDQRQHLEITGPRAAVQHALRRGARRARAAHHQGVGQDHGPPDPTSKMSKTGSTDRGVIWMMDEPAKTAKKIRSAVTDTGSEIRYDVDAKPGVSNLLVIHSVLSGTPIADLERRFEGHGYGDLKKEVAEVAVEAITPFRDRMTELLADPAELDRAIADGADRAREVAKATMDRVRDRVGLLPTVR